MRFRVSKGYEVCHDDERVSGGSSMIPPCGVMGNICLVEAEKGGRYHPLMAHKMICKTFDLQ